MTSVTLLDVIPEVVYDHVMTDAPQRHGFRVTLACQSVLFLGRRDARKFLDLIKHVLCVF